MPLTSEIVTVVGYFLAPSVRVQFTTVPLTRSTVPVPQSSAGGFAVPTCFYSAAAACVAT